MAQSSYPKVVLLDNENNPFTPLVDISSIYSDVASKDDAGVITGPLSITTLNSTDVNIANGGLQDVEGNSLYFILNIEIVNRNINITRIKASDILDVYFNNNSWDDLMDVDELPWIDRDEEYLQAKKY